MKVKELIEELQRYSLDEDIYIISIDENPIDGDGWGIKEVYAVQSQRDDIRGVYIATEN